MPLSKQVHSLYFQCLNCVFENLFEIITSGVSSQHFEQMRKYFLTNLHGGIREHILKLAVLKDKNRIQFLLQLINLLMDSSITYLCPVSGLGFLLPHHYSILINHLKKRECIGLKSLYIRVLCELNEKEAVIKANKLLYSLLSKGLAKNLTVLVLGRCCDNEILKLLGQYCTHLTKLDVTASWFVNDNGFKYLCLKNADCIQDLSEGETHTPQLVLNLMSLPIDHLNTCCFTLCDIRIQETNTTDFTVLMLLIFIKNLRTLGGFIYSRSVGDNIVFLSRLAQERGHCLKLSLTELWDTHLTTSKLEHLSDVVPNLTAMYTRSNHLQQPLLTKFKKLTEISVDIDFSPYPDSFFNYLVKSGYQFKKITLIDQSSYIDMIRILELCPNLTEINGCITIDDLRKELNTTSLTKASVKVLRSDIIAWIFANAPNLEYFEAVVTGSYIYNPHEISEFENRWLKNIIKMKPACFNTLKYFIVNISESRTIGKKTIWRFVRECKRLKLIGDLHSWSVPEKTYKKINNRLRRKNLDIGLVYKAEFVPNVTMQSIKDFY